MAARTLYVHRPLTNAADLIAWAKGQGFATTMLPDDLHVTEAYSREPFDWSGLRPDPGHVLAASGARTVQAFGKAIVLTFESPKLQERWRQFRAAGASWDFPDYSPHVTFTYDPGSVDLAKVMPYGGPLMFGGEDFAEIDDEWSSNLQEKTRTTPRLGYGTMTDLLVAGFEVKSTGSADSGEFEGYGSVFGNVDSHGDVVVPGAFAAGLAEMKAAGRQVAMHLEHGVIERGGRRSIGTWTFVGEDSQGLHVKGKVAGMDTETGRYTHARIRDKALSGLSIGFRVRQGGAVLGTKAAAMRAGARRVLRDVAVEEISLVDTPSNAQSLVLQVKAQGALLDTDRARSGIAALMSLHQRVLAGDTVPTAEDRADFLSHLQEVEHAMGGPLLETGTKSAPTTRRECEDALRDAGFTRSQAARLAATAFIEAPAQRDAGGEQARTAETKAAFDELMAVLG